MIRMREGREDGENMYWEELEKESSCEEIEMQKRGWIERDSERQSLSAYWFLELNVNDVLLNILLGLAENG